MPLLVMNMTSNMKKVVSYLFLIIFAMALVSCGKKKETTSETTGAEEGNTGYSVTQDSRLQQYKLEQYKKELKRRSPCDTLNLLEYVFHNYPPGTYVVNFDKTLTFNVPKPALIYYNHNGTYIFAVIAMSKPGEKLIKPNNVVGYDQSFIDLDSTKLGTAFFYLTLFKCEDSTYTREWEYPIPNHGGFNYFQMKTWKYNGTPYIRVDFHYARGVGHFDYNYFLLNGITSRPHLLLTYEGIDFKRTIANVNNDRYPDYYEYLYYNLPNRIYAKDSVAFIWDTKDSLYYNTRNRRQTQPY